MGARAARPSHILTPREIRDVYELHSEKSTAVNSILLKLAPTDSAWQSSPKWREARTTNLLSMWLHQVLSFEYAMNSLVGYARYLARKQRSPILDRAERRKAGKKLWPTSRSAQKVHRNVSEMGLRWEVDSDVHFKHELSVAPRHYVWRDAWAHHGGRLREYDAAVYEYFRNRSALAERDDAAWPLEKAWSEARTSFSKLLDLFVSSALDEAP